jgi:Eco29kI restriction endonuclease
VDQPAYNPLDKLHLAESVSRALHATAVWPLEVMTSRKREDRFPGVGIYALYYRGDSALYPENDPDRPVYVGSALPKGGRTGGMDYAEGGTELRSRLRQHARSIDQVKNLELGNFSCRFLILDDLWVLLSENYMISHYRPVWNNVVWGFGIHNPGRRRPQNRSRWDELHPGRPFATKRPPNELTTNEIENLIERFYAGEDVGEPEPSEAVLAAASEESADAPGDALGE